MEIRNEEFVIKKVKELDIKYIRLWFTDVLGFLKSFAITSDELGRAFEEGLGFDGSSIEGFARIEESDMLACPDPATFRVLPVGPEGLGKIARMICDIKTSDGKPYEGDSRLVLKRQLERAEKMGYSFYVGPEMEYFYFKNNEGTDLLDQGGYFDLTPVDVACDLRRETMIALEKLEVPVEYAHHEVAPSQHEIDLCYTNALTMADTAVTYRLIVKEVAFKNGVYATFMPKPLFGKNGSGMHTHQSLFKGDRNAFFDSDDKYQLSRDAKCYIAGLLRHSREITAITCQWVNSYKRLVPGYEAPAYISWGRRNRSALVRIPMYKPGKEKSIRVEYRSPDPACNPYLAFAVMLAAGLEGIKNNYELPDPIEEDIFTMKPERRAELGIRNLPGNLFEAIQETEKSNLVHDALGDHIFHKFIENKKIEWDQYITHVTDYELSHYLPIL